MMQPSCNVYDQQSHGRITALEPVVAQMFGDCHKQWFPNKSSPAVFGQKQASVSFIIESVKGSRRRGKTKGAWVTGFTLPSVTHMHKKKLLRDNILNGVTSNNKTHISGDCGVHQRKKILKTSVKLLGYILFV